MAVGLLLFNDHLLKGVGPGWLTGKVSDFAGIYFFPFLLALLLSPLVRNLRVLRWVAFGSTAIVFCAMKLSPAVAEAVEGLATLVSGSPSEITVDSTDLVALIVLIPGHRLWVSITTRPLDIHRLQAVLIVGVAGLATVATSSSAPPEVKAVWNHDGQIHARVVNSQEGESIYVRRGSDDWDEVEIPWVDGEQTSSPLPTFLPESRPQCDVDEPSFCIDKKTVSANQISTDGGLTWESHEPDTPPSLYVSPESEPSLVLRGPVCESGNTGTSERVCTRQLSPRTALFDLQWEATTSTDAGWAPIDVPQDPELLEVTGLCEMSDPEVCYRHDSGGRSWRVWKASDDGGVTWRQIGEEEGGTFYDLAMPLVARPECGLEETCYRVVNRPDRDPLIEQSEDGGASWESSWTQSATAGRMFPSEVAVTEEAVSVSLGITGVVSRDRGGDWQYEGVGPVPEFNDPGLFRSGPTVFPAVVWSYLAWLILFAGWIAVKKGMAQQSRARLGWLTLAAIGYTLIMVSLASVRAPLGLWDAGLAGGLLDLLLLVVVPLAFFIPIGRVGWAYGKGRTVLRWCLSLFVGVVIGFGIYFVQRPLI